MINPGRLSKRVKRKILHLRLAPIRVFCFHVVEDYFKPETTWDCDFIQTDRFKMFVIRLLNDGYSFISLADAYHHISSDSFRKKRYACLTFDDGVSSIVGILPWLGELGIPVTLFVNPGFLLGDKRQDKPMRLLSLSDLKELMYKYSINNGLTVGSHGYRHKDCSTLSIKDFTDNIIQSAKELSSINNVVPFFAYPFGSYNSHTDQVLRAHSYIPVYCDGQKNYNDQSCIHRELYL